MNKVISMPKSLDDAIGTALIAIEKNNFQKVIKLLEYVKLYKNDYDEVMVNYALLISYMNTGVLDKAHETLNILENTKVSNPQVAEVLKSIKKDLINQVTISHNNQTKAIQDLSTKDIISKLNLSDRQQIIIENYRKFGDNTIWSNLLNEDEVADLRMNYTVYLNQMGKFSKYIVNFKGFTSEFSPLDVYEFLKEVEDDEFFWLNFNFKNLELILNNKTLHQFVKNYVLENIAKYTKLKILPIYNIRLSELNGEISTIDLPVYEELKDETIKRIGTFYQLNTKHDAETIATMIESIVDVVATINYPKDVFTNGPLMDAVVAYIVNDIFLGRENDITIKATTNLAFEDVREEIKKYEELISYLIT